MKNLYSESTTIINSTSNLITILDPEFNIISANNAVYEMVNKTPEQLYGENWCSIFHNGDIPEDCPIKSQLRPQKEKVTIEVEGLNRYYKVECNPFVDKNGEIEKIILVATDITGQMAAEQTLERKNRDLRSFLELSQVLTETLDMDSVIQLIVEKAVSVKNLDSGAIYLVNGNHLFMKATWPELPPGFPDEFRNADLKDHPHINKSIKGKQLLIIPDTNKENLSEAEKQICENRGLRSIIYLPLVIKGEVPGILILGTIGRTFDFTGEDAENYRVFSNVAEASLENARLFKELNDEISFSEKAQERLSESEEKFRSVFMGAADGIIVLDKKATVLDVNSAFTEITGINRGYVVNKSGFELAREFVTLKQLPGILELIKKLISKQSINSYEMQFRDKYLELTARINKPSDFLIGIIRDITSRKLAEIELSKHRANLEDRVKERTLEVENQKDQILRANKKLAEKNEELERFNQLFVGREFRIKELKEKIKELEEKLKKNP